MFFDWAALVCGTNSALVLLIPSRNHLEQQPLDVLQLSAPSPSKPLRMGSVTEKQMLSDYTFCHSWKCGLGWDFQLAAWMLHWKWGSLWKMLAQWGSVWSLSRTSMSKRTSSLSSSVQRSSKPGSGQPRWGEAPVSLFTWVRLNGLHITPHLFFFFFAICGSEDECLTYS